MPDPREDKYWRRARFRLYLPEGEPPPPWHKSIPWWLWLFSLLVILGSLGAVLYILKGV